MSEANQQALGAENGKATDMTASAIKEQEISDFNARGWTKLIAPAKVNLYLGIGEKQPNGYHQAESLLHALNTHDVLYMRARPAKADAGLTINLSCTGSGDVEVPDIAPEQNIAYKAVASFADLLGRTEDENIDIRIVKSIPFQAGLGGGSSDAAAALLGAAHLWGVDPQSPQLEEAAAALGSDVPFFLRGGCALYDGTGESFDRALEPMRKNVVLVKPQSGVSTKAAYDAFDRMRAEGASAEAETEDARRSAMQAAGAAEDVPLFNSLAAASESLAPELARIREWLLAQPGVESALLCGSGSATFAVCSSLNEALAVVAEARKQGWWARSTSFGSLRAAVVPER